MLYTLLWFVLQVHGLSEQTAYTFLVAAVTAFTEAIATGGSDQLKETLSVRIAGFHACAIMCEL